MTPRVATTPSQSIERFGHGVRTFRDSLSSAFVACIRRTKCGRRKLPFSSSSCTTRPSQSGGGGSSRVPSAVFSRTLLRSVASASADSQRPGNPEHYFSDMVASRKSVAMHSGRTHRQAPGNTPPSPLSQCASPRHGRGYLGSYSND